MEEMEQEPNFIKGLWAKAMAYSEGNNEKAKSLYMQYRVQSIKDDFKLLEIAYNELSKEKLWDTIKNSFSSDEEKQKIKQEQKVKQEEEKYGKIKGWLIFFAILIVLNDISIVMISEYFKDEYNSALEIMYLNNQSDMASNFNKIFYLDLVGVFMIILLTITFFTKSNITKAVAIFFFAIKLVVVPLQISYLYQISPEIGISPDTMRMIGGLLWAIIFLLYFIFSARVKKTFVKQKNIVVIIGLSLIIPVLIGMSYYFKINKLSDSYNLSKKAIKLGNESINNNTNQAKEYYDKAIKIISDNRLEIIKIANEIADKYFYKKDYNNAIYFYEIAVSKRDTGAQFRLAYSYNEIGNYDNAILNYRNYIFETQSEGAMRNLGLVYEKIGQYKKAQEWFKKAFDIYIEKGNNGDKDAAKWLALMYKYGEGVSIDYAKAKYWEDKSK